MFCALMFSAIPTTVVHGIVSLVKRMHFPIGSSPFHNALPIASLTTTTRGARPIFVAEWPSAHDPRSHGREVIRRSCLKLKTSELANGVDPRDIERASLDCVERHRDCSSCGHDARNSAHFVVQSIAERRLSVGESLNAAHRGFDIRRFGRTSYPMRSSRTSLKAANEEPGADEQDDRERSLKDQQRRPHRRMAIAVPRASRLQASRRDRRSGCSAGRIREHRRSTASPRARMRACGVGHDRPDRRPARTSFAEARPTRPPRRAARRHCRTPTGRTSR